MAKRILIVDDDKAARGLLRDMLLTANFEVIEAEDGLMALGLLRQERFDLLITDRSMPHLGGIELLQKMREEKLVIPAIMVSAFGEESFWAQAIAAGAQDYLVKPSTFADVMKTVQKHLS